MTPAADRDTVSIRPVEAGDVDELFALMCALADTEGERAHLTVTPERLRETGFGDRPSWSGFFATLSGEIAGYATFTHDFHLWSGAARITLDDIFVRPECRSLGIGETLMKAVFDEAEKRRALVSWTVQTGNERAISFYERLGASYRVTGKCLWRPAG